MRRSLVIAMLVVLSGCSKWPAGSYVAMPNENDAGILAPVVVDQIARRTERGESVTLLPPQAADNMLTTMIVADLETRGINVVQKGGTHQVQYITDPLDGGQILRVVIDNSAGGAQYFVRDTAGKLVPGGPFTEVAP